ncbi:MAG TPA: creatininase family protein, partial [Longimicrobium sp.]|nr:creatininase family protein [Longimicrobium sp.]
MDRSYALSDLPWPAVAAHLERDRRLIIPVGACDPQGPHLPIGAGTSVAEALARDLSQEFGVLRAPTFHYGVNLPGEGVYPGTASLRAKTLHRALNELLHSWAGHGFDEFIAITANAHAPHAEAVATVRAPRARVRVVEALTVDLAGLLDGEPGPEHAGEVMTSLLLHLRPDAVQMDRVTEEPGNPAKPRKFGLGRLRRIPPASRGTLGSAALATA